MKVGGMAQGNNSMLVMSFAELAYKRGYTQRREESLMGKASRSKKARRVSLEYVDVPMDLLGVSLEMKEYLFLLVAEVGQTKNKAEVEAEIKDLRQKWSEGKLTKSEVERRLKEVKRRLREVGIYEGKGK